MYYFSNCGYIYYGSRYFFGVFIGDSYTRIKAFDSFGYIVALLTIHGRPIDAASSTDAGRPSLRDGWTKTCILAMIWSFSCPNLLPKKYDFIEKSLIDDQGF